MRDLHPQIIGRRTGAGLQFATCAAGVLRGIYKESKTRGVDAAVIEAQSGVRTIELGTIGGRVFTWLGDVVRPFAKLGAHLSSKPRRHQRDFTFEKNSPD